MPISATSFWLASSWSFAGIFIVVRYDSSAFSSGFQFIPKMKIIISSFLLSRKSRQKPIIEGLVYPVDVVLNFDEVVCKIESIGVQPVGKSKVEMFGGEVYVHLGGYSRTVRLLAAI